MVALVRGVHGLQGAVRFEVLTDRPEDALRPGATLHREGVDRGLTVAAAEAIPDGPGWRLRFDEVPDRTAADASATPTSRWTPSPTDALPIGEYYWHQVVGCAVRDLADQVIGVVHDIYRVGGAEVFVVRGDPYGEFDLPAVRAFIRIFAPARGDDRRRCRRAGPRTGRRPDAASPRTTPEAGSARAGDPARPRRRTTDAPRPRRARRDRPRTVREPSLTGRDRSRSTS